MTRGGTAGNRWNFSSDSASRQFLTFLIPDSRPGHEISGGWVSFLSVYYEFLPINGYK
jgi:hypothetical protein